MMFIVGLCINKMDSYLMTSPVNKIQRSKNKRTHIPLIRNNVLKIHFLKLTLF